jgi:hypothetical protein
MPPRSSSTASALSGIVPAPPRSAIRRRPSPALVSYRTSYSIDRSSYRASCVASPRASAGSSESGSSPRWRSTSPPPRGTPAGRSRASLASAVIVAWVTRRFCGSPRLSTSPRSPNRVKSWLGLFHSTSAT